MRRLLSIALALSVCGCGASTVRLAIGPTVDTGGRAGVEATVSLGLGTPLDFSHRSHHYMQALGAIGGGLDGNTGSREFLARADVSYIYWMLPRLDLRTGAGYSYREVGSGTGLHRWNAVGGHFGLMPVVYERKSNWIPIQVAVGGEMRVDWLFDEKTSNVHSLFSFPVIAEVNFLAAGD